MQHEPERQAARTNEVVSALHPQQGLQTRGVGRHRARMLTPGGSRCRASPPGAPLSSRVCTEVDLERAPSLRP
ncbi:hypothetical protein D187_009278 [Cystobacter fuscus DSM 2262]|uniref:Uncharacterized protein n=1 Tax=Cystobacter fuscus (strain ATCC 25194 / DSM 2262 / NBRC 100088 / M29) TaxID=1242864 RepID=S9P096_CYSF2|nr:hypothetical protein D187_009278 [Cystobacter fuscus DSM 2262]